MRALKAVFSGDTVVMPIERHTTSTTCHPWSSISARGMHITVPLTRLLALTSKGLTCAEKQTPQRGDLHSSGL